ncbi:MAG: YceI family protein [Candidatus Omnitrophica bacterium]|nr:YceI family protein [Candidatus Omnitrophota bacterium]
MAKADRWLLLGILIWAVSFPSLASGAAPCPPNVFHFDAAKSRISGSIPYAVIGQYVCVFQRYEGELRFDFNAPQNAAVALSIDAASGHSGFLKLDQLARSRLLMDAKKYPRIIFKSLRIAPAAGKSQYHVWGELTLHGVTRSVDFPFEIESSGRREAGSGFLLRGVWRINRKDYNIIWHPSFDKAGIVVGDILTVDWEITAR